MTANGRLADEEGFGDPPRRQALAKTIEDVPFAAGEIVLAGPGQEGRTLLRTRTELGDHGP